MNKDEDKQNIEERETRFLNIKTRKSLFNIKR